MFKKGLTGGSYLIKKFFADAEPEKREEKTIIRVGAKHGRCGGILQGDWQKQD